MTHDKSAARVSALVDRYSDPSLSMARVLFENRRPESVAYQLIAPDLSSRPLTWGELEQESAALARGLRTAYGVGPGVRVATLMGKSRDYLVTLMAIWRSGAIHVPVFTAFGADQVELRLRAAHCRVVVCDATQEKKLAGVPQASATHPAVVTSSPGDSVFPQLQEITKAGRSDSTPVDHNAAGPLIEIYTSGTTGTPKGVIVGMHALAAFRCYLEMGLALTRDDVFWNAADPGWAYGLYYGVLAPCLTDSTTLTFEGAFTPSAYLRILHDYRVTHFAAAPTVYRAMEAAALPSPGPLALRRASSAGEPLTPQVNEWAIRYLGVPVHDHYGQTETGMVVNNHHHPSLSQPLKPGSMGQPMPGWRVSVLRNDRDEIASPHENGRVAIDVRASPLAWFAGYKDDPERTREKFSADGRWYLTGDVARRDDEGDLFFSARDDDVIIMSGYRIGPLELESILLTHPDVSECAVVAVPHRISGEMVEAVVVLKAGCAPCNDLTEALQLTVKRGFAAHAYPRRVHYVESLPKTASGKIQRSRVRQMLAELN